jgi:CheY-like chemotaxis protein
MCHLLSSWLPQTSPPVHTCRAGLQPLRCSEGRLPVADRTARTRCLRAVAPAWRQPAPWNRVGASTKSGRYTEPYRGHGSIWFGCGIRVVVAEDNALFREGLAQLVERTAELELVGAAPDSPELLALLADHDVDVVVTDIRMPPTHTDEGIQVAAWLRSERPSVGVVVLSQFSEPEYALALLETGSAGRAYLLKDPVSEVDDLMEAIRVVA